MEIESWGWAGGVSKHQLPWVLQHQRLRGVGSWEGDEGPGALPPPGRNRVHSRKNTGNQPGSSFTGKAGITARRKSGQIAGSTRPCRQGPQLQISMEEAKQAREIPRFTYNSRKNLLEMQQTLPSCLAPSRKDQTHRVWEAKGT